MVNEEGKTLDEVKTSDQLNSMLHWYPKIAGLVPTPKTLFVAVDQIKLYDALNGIPDMKYISGVVRDVEAAVAAIGGPPAFLRTDQCAGKHEWVDTCFIGKMGDVRKNILGVAEANECAGIMGLRYKAFAVREFLRLESTFKAFKGMPVSREYRFFSEHGEVICYHPYWPEEAIRFYGETPEPADWRERLHKLQSLPGDFPMAYKLACKATTWSDQAWSVDVCKTEGGDWYVTDMALMRDSYHWGDCPNNPEAKKQ